jgi:threonylcarbamoyladenosine tRNA methylthiotransferase MtaB
MSSHTHTSRTVAFKTIGCRLNQAETAQIAAQFEAAGYRIVDAKQPCDVAVVHTCTITHGAERDCARWARRLRREGARRVVLAGCAVVHDGDRLQQETGVDLTVNQTEKFHLIERLHGPTGMDPDPTVFAADAAHAGTPVFAATRALVKAQDGCRFRCSYCIVPDTRGEPQSRPRRDVVDDIQRFADNGFREIVITGANLGCYHDGTTNLVDLLESAEAIQGIDRIRISSIESTTVEREIIDFMATSAKLCHFLHLPLQSGDAHTLARMKRRYSVAQYRDVVDYAINRIPNLGLGSDIIVGFPGEDDAAFENTMACVHDLPFSNLHVFSYSQRRGTPAASMPDQLDPATKKERSAKLIALGDAKRDAFAKSFIGTPVTALIERVSEEGTATGWTDQYLPVRIATQTLAENDIATVTPTQTDGDVLCG